MPNPVRRLFHATRRLFPSKSDWRAMRTPLVASIASGLLLRLAYPPIEWEWIPWIALAPFLWALEGRTLKQSAWIGWFFGFAFYYPNLTWLNTLSSVNPLAPIGIVILGAACAVYAALFAIGASAFARHMRPVSILLIPAWWTALEYLRSLGEMGFPWVYLGHSQAEATVLIQVCALTGVYGLSFAIVLAALAIARLARALSLKQRLSPAISEAVLALIVFVGICVTGTQTLGNAKDKAVLSLSLRLIQPGVPQHLKLASYASSDPVERRQIQTRMVQDLEDQLKRAKTEYQAVPDLYILPEAAITDPFFNLRKELVSRVEGWARELGAPIFLGANRFAPAPGLQPNAPGFYSRSDMFNSAWIVHPDKGLAPVAYDKMHLVPFGEYGSWFEVIPGFTEYILGIGSFTPGRTQRIFDVFGTQFASLICFESCFPYLVRQYARTGIVDWLCVITNDAWYKTSSGARRHQTQSIFRAVESRLPIVRVANTGISCVIDPWGRTLTQTPLTEGKPVTRNVSLRLPAPGDSRPPTPYMRPWGEWFSWLCLSACIVALGLICWRARKCPDSEPDA